MKCNLYVNKIFSLQGKMKHADYYPFLLKKISRYLALVVIVIATLGLAGWQFDIEFFKRPLSLAATMNPVAAVAFILSAVSLLMLLQTQRGIYYTVSNIAAGLVFSIGLLRVAEVMLNLQLGFDHLLFPNKLANDEAHHIYNHIAPNAGANFLLIGMAMLLVGSYKPWRRRTASILASVSLGIAMFSIIGYLYQVKEFYGLLVYFPMPVHGAVCFLLLALSLIFYNSDTGFMQTIASRYWGGYIARRLVPAIILAPVILGLVSLIIAWRYQFSTELVAAAIISCVVMFLFGIIWPLTSALNKSDAGRVLVLEQLKHFNKNLEATITERTEALMATEKKFQNTLDSMIEGVQIIDFNWHYLYLNDAAIKPTPYTRQEMLGFTVMQKYPGIEQTLVFKAMQQCMDDRVPCHLETEFVFPNTVKMDFEISMQPVPEGLFILSVDITARKAAQEAMLKSSRLYAFISAINQGIVHVTDKKTLFDTACNIAVGIGQYRLGWIGLINQHNQTLDMVTIKGEEAVISLMKKYASVDLNNPLVASAPTLKAVRTEHYVVSNDILNDPFFVPWRNDFTQNGTRSIISLPLKTFGKVVGVFSLQSDEVDFFDDREIDLLEEAAQDISFALENFEKENRRKLAEDHLLQNETRLQRAQSIAHLGHFVHYPVTNVVEWSDELCRMYGLEPGKTNYTFDDWVALIHPDDVDYVLHVLRQQRLTLNAVVFKYRLVRPDGTLRHIHSECQFEFDATGKPVSLYGINLDVTEQRLAEQKLLRNQSQLKDAQAIAGIGSWQIDMVNNVVEWSDEQFHILGFRPGEVEPGNELFFSTVHPDDSGYVIRGFEHAMQTFVESSSRFRFIRKDGALRHAYCEWKFEFDGNQKPTRVYGIVQDVTERKQHIAQQELFASIINSSDDAIISKSLEGTITSWNHGAEKILGYVAGQIIGKHISILVPPNRRGEEEKILELIRKGQSVDHYETERVKKDGTIIYVSLTVSPIIDASGAITGASKILRDITEKRKADSEIKQLNETLENRVTERTTELTEANKALESFTYSVSHDLRAPVRAIVGFTKIIEKEYSKDFKPELKELFNFLETSGTRMNSIIDDMLALTKYEKEKLRLAPVNMEQLFNRVWANISYSAPHFAKLQITELPTVEADMSMLEQVVVNLVSNAIKYSSKKEQPLVTVGCENAGGHYTFYVSDNGAGFDMKNYHRMFGAFQRLHSLSEFEGTGVGLLLVKKIVEKHGGVVWAEGKVNEGATFYFTLPCLPGN